MNSPDPNRFYETQMPDHFGTGKQPVRQKSYRSLTVALLLILIGVNLVTIALSLRLRAGDAIHSLKSVFLPGSEQLDAFSPLTGGERAFPQVGPAEERLSDGEILQELLPSVVQISGQGDGQTNSFCGLVLTQDGYLLTNSHCAENAHALSVTLSDGTTHTAVCVGSDRKSDIAVLKIDVQGLPPVRCGDCECMKRGDRVRLLLPDGTLKRADVLETDKTLELYGETVRFLRSDAEEAGFLVNQSGQVIAVSMNGDSGEALPIQTAQELANDLISYGCINPEASLGIQITVLSEIQRRYWQLPQGVLISRTAVNGSAYLAGLRSGDLLLQIGAWRLETAEDYQKAMELLHPGDTVELLVYRLGQEFSVKIVLQNTPEPNE